MRELCYIALSVIYLLPAILAYSANHPDASRIFRLNLFLGWTVAGWIAALNWSRY